MLRLFSGLSLAVKIPGLVVLAVLLSVGAVGFVAYTEAEAELRAAYESKLAALVRARTEALDTFLGTIRGEMLTLASSEAASTPMSNFEGAFSQIAYDSDAKAILQKAYIADNPNAAGEKHKLDYADDGSAYAHAHKRFHPWFRELLLDRGYYDIFLVTAEGDVVYTVYKELDFATNLNDGEWKDTDLARVFRAVRDNPKPHTVSFTDFAPYAPSNGAPASFIAAPVLVDGAFRGALVFQVPIEPINAVMQEAIGLGETGETYLVGADGLMRSDSRFSTGSDILKTKSDNASVTDALAGNTGIAEIVDYRGVEALSAYDAVDFEGVRWAVLGEIATEEVFAPAAHMREIMMIVCLVTLAVVTLLGLFVARGITRPLVAVSGAMERLTSGEKGVDIPATERGDELGQMARSVLVFKENAEKIAELEAERIEAEKQKAEQERQAEQARQEEERRQVEERAQAEREASEQRRRDREQLAERFDSTVGTIIETLGQSAERMQSTAREMSTMAGQASEQTNAVATASEQAAHNVQAVAGAAEEMSASIADISKQVSQSARIAEQAVAKADHTNEQVQALADAADQISDVIELINNIAHQTNLLALNATIEAARAGEAGKGFAVVAAEVKNLSNATSKATEKIAEQISGIQSSTGSAVEAIRAIGDTIREISGISTSIAGAVEEQDASTREIARNVQEAAIGADEVTSNTAGVSEVVTKTGASASEVLDVADEVSEHARSLRGQVAEFLGAIRAA